MSHKLIPPNEQEDKAINRAALNDPESAPLSNEELAAMRFGKGWQTKINAVLKDYVHSNA